MTGLPTSLLCAPVLPMPARGLLGEQVVPTTYRDMRNHSTNTNQYSVTEHYKASDIAAGHNLPGVFFFYDMSPIKVPTLRSCSCASADCFMRCRTSLSIIITLTDHTVSAKLSLSQCGWIHLWHVSLPPPPLKAGLSVWHVDLHKDDAGQGESIATATAALQMIKLMWLGSGCSKSRCGCECRYNIPRKRQRSYISSQVCVQLLAESLPFQVLLIPSSTMVNRPLGRRLILANSHSISKCREVAVISCEIVELVAAKRCSCACCMITSTNCPQTAFVERICNQYH